MPLFVPIALVFAAMFLIIISLASLFTTKRMRVMSRLNTIGNIAVQEQKEIGEEEPEETEWVVVSKPREKRFLDRYFDKISLRLEKARLLYRPQEFFLLSLAFALATMLVVFFLVKPRLNVSRGDFSLVVMIALLGLMAGFVIPSVYLSLRESQQRHLLSDQVGDMLLLMGNYLRAGHGFLRAVELVSREVPSPLGDELKKFIRDTKFGKSIDEALTDLERRTEDEDLGLAVTAIKIHYEVGGNLAEILDNINYTIRERIRLKGEIRTLTTQGRLTALVISLLPVVVGAFIFILNPEFIGILFSEAQGRLMLLLAVAAELLGILLIRKIVRIEV
jgi:tight adherence protein B